MKIGPISTKRFHPKFRLRILNLDDLTPEFFVQGDILLVQCHFDVNIFKSDISLSNC